MSRTTVRHPQASAARRVALDVVEAVRVRGAYANLLLPTLSARAGLSPQDAAFATELAYGTLRRQGTYDRIIALASGRRLGQIDPPLLDVLELGAHQLLGMRTPPHAAVHQSVELASAIGGRGAAGFVNAVLRKVGALEAAAWIDQLVETERDAAVVAGIRYSHPAWIVRAFAAAVGEPVDGQRVTAILDADDAPGPIGLVALPGLADRSEVPGEPDPLSPVGVRLAGGDPAPIVASGRVRVQDPGSQLAALALVAVRAVEPDERWLDLCAGPGGKAALLAAEAAQHGAAFTANEITPTRARLVVEALAVVPGDPRVETGDGRRFADGARRFDRVLLDAPCSGLGALRRRPEARWRKQPEELAELVPLQRDLLDAAIAATVPGGLIAYVTCSPVIEETTEAIAGALAAHPGLRAIDTAPVLASVTGTPMADAARGTAAQLWPDLHGTDAMFIQLLQVAE